MVNIYIDKRTWYIKPCLYHQGCIAISTTPGQKQTPVSSYTRPVPSFLPYSVHPEGQTRHAPYVIVVGPVVLGTCSPFLPPILTHDNANNNDDNTTEPIKCETHRTLTTGRAGLMMTTMS